MYVWSSFLILPSREKEKMGMGVVREEVVAGVAINQFKRLPFLSFA